MDKSGLLDGKAAIRAYLHDASDYKLEKWLQAGMPVRIENGSWTAHKENIEKWFAWYTAPDQTKSMSRKKSPNSYRKINQISLK
jgi:hypothetical protein